MHRLSGSEKYFGSGPNPAFTSMFFYATPGSGITYNVGNSFAAPNKLTALTWLLNLNGTGLVHLLRNENFFNGNACDFHQGCRGEPSKTLVPCTHGPISDAVDSFGGVPAITSLLTDTSKDTSQNGYCVNRLAMTCGNWLGLDQSDHVPTDIQQQLESINVSLDNVNVDTLLWAAAAARGFDSVQLTAQPNSYGGWTTEIIDIFNPAIRATTDKTPLDPSQNPEVNNPYTRLRGSLKTASLCDDDDQVPCNFNPAPGSSPKNTHGQFPYAFGYRCLFCDLPNHKSEIAEQCRASGQPGDGRPDLWCPSSYRSARSFDSLERELENVWGH